MKIIRLCLTNLFSYSLLRKNAWCINIKSKNKVYIEIESIILSNSKTKKKSIKV